MPAFEMDWRDVLFLSYPVDPATVAPHLPDRLSVDTFEGDAYLSVVPFVIENIRPAGLPAAVGLTTPELNLRTYVSIDDTPGVYFFNLDADDLLGVVGARLFNHLPYYYAEMDYDPGSPTRFESRRRTPGTRPLRFSGTYEPAGDAYRPDPGTVEHFLVERYRYFTETQDGAVHYAAIEHEPWTLQPADYSVVESTLFRANGFEHPDTDPVATYSRGLPVEASASQQWGESGASR
jgi:uncharacterized protein YqjF (DUF2071 family)